MKTLLITRHAKSDWDNEELTDFERTLNARGMKDAPAMAKLIASKVSKIDKIVSSSAVRAFSTAKFFAQAFDYDENEIEKNIEFYTNGAKHIIKILMSQNNENDVVMIFGHNPTVSSLVAYFIGEVVGNLPTCSVACIDFDVDNWQDIDKINGKLRFFEKPSRPAAD